MSWYDYEMAIDTLWGGNESPKQNRARLLINLYALQDMPPEARLAKSERLEAAFAKINAAWATQGFIGRK